MPEVFSAAVPGIVQGVALLLIGSLFGVIGGIVAKGRSVAKEHTELVCHLDESKNLEEKVDKLTEKVDKLTEYQEKQNAVLRELNGRELDREHKRIVEQGFASVEEKKAFERLYEPYHGINGNGTRTSSFEDVMGMKMYQTT